MRCRFHVSLATALLLLASVARAQTREFLDAPAVTGQIRVQWDASKKQMLWAVDDDRVFRELVPDSLFLTRRSVYVTYPRLNPLRIQATASDVAADDPSAAILSKLLDALVGVPAIIMPQAHVAIAAPQCPEVGRLFADLYGPATSGANIKNEYAAWATAIDEGLASHPNGADAVKDAVTLITKDGSLLKVLDGILSRAPATLEKIEAAASGDQPTGCDTTLLKVLLFTNPRGRIQQVRALHDTIAELADLLKRRYAIATRWNGLDYQISDEIKPTAKTMRKVTVRVVDVSTKVDEVSTSLTIAQKETGSAAFTVRKYSSFAPEIGVGAVVGSMDRPQYGTATNADGQTIVAKVPDDSMSIQPGVLVNFVCRCAAGPLAPMLQVGASTSKDVPGVLLGGGVRLFGAGKGDVAVGGGVMLGWVKDLQKLKVGDVVTGTRDIEADLGYATRPRPAGYFVIQYKF